jgi:hypothetical protein
MPERLAKKMKEKDVQRVEKMEKLKYVKRCAPPISYSYDPRQLIDPGFGK